MTSSSVYGFRKSPTMVDFPGRLAIVFFTSGCNFRCGFCHNATLLQERKAGYGWDKLAEACDSFRGQWVDGVVVSGGEPTITPDFFDLLQFFHDRGLAIKLDTNGSNPDKLREALPLLDYVAMDVKSSLGRYPELAAFKKTDAIRESVAVLKESGVAYEFRTTVIGSFHTDDEMHEIGALVDGARRWVLQAFVPRDDLPSPELRTEPRTSPDRMKALGKLMDPYADELVVRGG